MNLKYGYTQRDLAWAAGFFDGEGSITLTATLPSYLRLEVTCSQKTQLPLVLFERWFGGNVYSNKPKKGEVCYVWKIYGANAVTFLSTLLPLLVVKGEDAKEVINIWTMHDWQRAKERHEARQVVRRAIHALRNAEEGETK
jgi:hypothetical protein